MDERHENLLKAILDKENLSHLYSWSSVKKARKLMNKAGFENPLNNLSWANLIDGALKGLEVVSIASFDWKLVGIVKLLQSWLKDKREEQAVTEQQVLYGANYDLTNPADAGYNSYNPPSYY